MNSIDVGAWNRWEKKVLDLLQYPEEYLNQLRAEFRASDCVLRIWKYPTFAEYSSCLAFKSVKHPTQSDYLLVTIVWNRPEDLRKFSSPQEGLKYRLGNSVQPSITIRHAAIEAELVLNSLRSLQGINCEPLPNWENLSLDGIISGVEIQSGNQKTSLSWINEGPTQWRELVESVETIHQKLRNSCQ